MSVQRTHGLLYDDDVVSSKALLCMMHLVVGAGPTAWEARPLPMGKDSIKRMAAAFQMCDSQQAFSGRIVGHCSRGILIFGLGITGALPLTHIAQRFVYLQCWHRTRAARTFCHT